MTQKIGGLFRQRDRAYQIWLSLRSLCQVRKKFLILRQTPISSHFPPSQLYSARLLPINQKGYYRRTNTAATISLSYSPRPLFTTDKPAAKMSYGGGGYGGGRGGGGNNGYDNGSRGNYSGGYSNGYVIYGLDVVVKLDAFRYLEVDIFAPSRQQHSTLSFSSPELEC